MKRVKMALFTMMTVALVMAWAVPALAEEAGLVNINTANVEQLMALDGIGESYAKRIIEFREKNGPFQNPEDLLKIKGIGEKTLESNKGRILVQSQ